MIIDGTDLVLGRTASYAAKKALLGENVNIINCEKIAITGKKESLFKEYKKRADRGTFKGPFLHRESFRIMKRAIRGMLPYKQPKGKTAFKRIKCYNGIPDEFKDKKLETLENANISKLDNLRYIYVRELSKFLGGKI